MEDKTLATEMIHEIKVSAKRWFIIAMAELLVIVLFVIFVFVIPVEEYEVSLDAEDGNANYIGNDLNGGLYNGFSESELQETPDNR